MKIINEQYKNRCLYSDFKTVSIYDEIVSIEYEKDGGVTIIIKSNYPALFRFTALKKV